MRMAEHFKPMAITLGDAAGIGPEIIVKAFRDAPEQLQGCVVVGDLAVMQRAALLVAQCDYHAPQMHVQLVADVHAFPGHIACDTNSASELVVPVQHNGNIIAVIDLDSPTLNRFDAEDAKGVEQLARMIADRI